MFLTICLVRGIKIEQLMLGIKIEQLELPDKNRTAGAAVRFLSVSSNFCGTAKPIVFQCFYTFDCVHANSMLAA